MTAEYLVVITVIIIFVVILTFLVSLLLEIKEMAFVLTKLVRQSKKNINETNEQIKLLKLKSKSKELDSIKDLDNQSESQ